MSILPDIIAVRQDAGANAIVLDLHVPADLAYFKGHFPGLPLLPGVVQVDWAMRFAALHLGVQPARFAGMKALKFTAPMAPGTTLSLDLRLADGPDNAGIQRVEFAFLSVRKKFSSGQLLFAGDA
jgi:3-hydroxymyristoyl/3-hydroxydecanoyl-(acyl carrier protein) dehydratase